MEWLLNLAPSFGTIAAAIVSLFVVHRILERGGARAGGRQFRNQLVMLALSLTALLVIVVALPVSENLRGQLLAFFGIVLSADLPTLMRERLGEALLPFFAREGLSLHDFDGFLLHPGGSKVLDTAEDALGLSRDQLRYSWQVLKNYGNMSSATALFVLKEALADKARGRFLLAAFGPGFSGYFIVLEL